MRLVFVTSRFPYPVEKGDKLRAFHQIRILSRLHEIHLVAISHRPVSEDELLEMKPYCTSVKVFRVSRWLLPVNLLLGWIEGLPLQVSYFLDRTIKRRVQYHIIGIDPDQVFCQLIRAAEYVRALPFQKTLDYMDVFSEGMAQLARKNKWAGIFYRGEARRLAAYERTLYKDFDRHTIISAQDKERLNLPSKQFIEVIPNGVDDSFDKMEQNPNPPYDLVFVGNLGYDPNIAAVKYLAGEILPALKRRGKTVTLLIAGARPVRSIVSLDRHQNITVSGWMPDIREAYRDGRIFVAPMISGLGLQNKILEAMSMGLPCITTTMVNNAIGAIDQEQILIADTVEKFADHIITLLDHPETRDRIAQQGREFVRENFRWEDQVRKLDEVLHTKNVYLTS